MRNVYRVVFSKFPQKVNEPFHALGLFDYDSKVLRMLNKVSVEVSRIRRPIRIEFMNRNGNEDKFK